MQDARDTVTSNGCVLPGPDSMNRKGHKHQHGWKSIEQRAQDGVADDSLFDARVNSHEDTSDVIWFRSAGKSVEITAGLPKWFVSAKGQKQ